MSCSAEPLSRVFIHIGSIPIYWYGAIIATGLLLGLVLASKEAENRGLHKDMIIDFLVFAIPIAVLSARIYYVIMEADQYIGGPFWKVFAVWEGGLAIHGALIGSVLTAIVYTRVRKVSFWQLADIIAPSLILGQAIGRWGNFMNQEAHGGPVSEAAYNNVLQYVPDFIMNQMCIDGVMYHPTFLYESLWNIFIFIGLLLFRKYNPLRGVIFLTYVWTYSVGRFFIEEMRTDSLYVLGSSIQAAKALSVLLIVGAIAIMIYRKKSGLADRHYDGKKVVTAKKSKK